VTAAAVKSAKKQRLVRGEPVIRRIMSATLRELARSGYAAMRIESVADRARVNKTTIYRRWPTKDALLRATLLSLADRHERSPLPDTGSLQSDLGVMVRRTLRVANSAETRVIARLFATESSTSELGRIAESVRASRDAGMLSVLRRASERGELRADVDPNFVFQTMRSASVQMLLHSGQLDESFVEQLLDLLLVGALATQPTVKKTRRASPGPARQRTPSSR
jgi:AcrR family transcriptional regulator